MYPENFRYTKEHEWVLVEGGAATIGITDHAQQELGDIVYVDLPKVGARVEMGKSFGSVESVKAVSDLVAALSGTIQEVNEEAQSKPETLNEDPYEKGWLIVIEPSNLQVELANLMDFNAAVEWHKAQTQSK